MASCLNDITQPIKLQYLNLGESTFKFIAPARYLLLCALTVMVSWLLRNKQHSSSGSSQGTSPFSRLQVPYGKDLQFNYPIQACFHRIGGFTWLHLEQKREMPFRLISQRYIFLLNTTLVILCCLLLDNISVGKSILPVISISTELSICPISVFVMCLKVLINFKSWSFYLILAI